MNPSDQGFPHDAGASHNAIVGLALNMTATVIQLDEVALSCLLVSSIIETLDAYPAAAARRLDAWKKRRLGYHFTNTVVSAFWELGEEVRHNASIV